MDEIEVDVVGDPPLEAPVLVEGLPGVGHVGKLAAEHLLEELDGELVRRVHAEHFPPQVTIENRLGRLAGAELHAVRTAGTDLLVLTGDHQATDPRGHYRLTATFLDIAEGFGVDRLFAMGGVPTGELVDDYTVLGAATTEAVADDLATAGVEFREDEPAGGIVGVSGLLLGLGERRDLPAACLMGETSGYLVDPKSARAVLRVLETLLGLEVDYASLEERADEMEEVVRQIQDTQPEASSGDEDLRYIG